MAKRITANKILNVTVPGPHSYVTYSDRRNGVGFTPPKLAELAGTYQTQDWGRTWVKILSTEVYIDGYDIEEAIVELRKQAEGLTDARLDVTTDSSDDYPRLKVRGARPAKPGEVTEVLRYLDWDKARRAESDNAQRERLIAQAKAMGLKPEDLQ